MYSDYPAICVDSTKESVRVCVKRGGHGVDFGNLFQKTGPATTGPDGPHSGADGLTMSRSVNLPLICAGGCGCPGYVSIDIT
jgi:hypothetical protein